MIKAIAPGRIFIEDSSVVGETRADGAYPHMADAAQLSRDRWLVLYGTRGWLGADQGFNGGDNDRGVIYQLRKDGPTGPILKESALVKYQEDWDAERNGVKCLKQHCHTGVFGVPRGALVRGKRVAHENVFVASWYRCPRLRGTCGADLPSRDAEEELFDRVFGVEWVQFRLREDGNDIEIIQPARMMRQNGYESGAEYCNLSPRTFMNKWYVKPAPLSDDMSQWLQVPHFGRGIAAIELAFNPARGLYEWTRTGPLFETGRQSGLAPSNDLPYRLTETSVVRHRDSWLIACRTAEPGSKNVPGTGWIRTDDPFAPLPPPVFPGAPATNAPTAVSRGPDGALRIFTGDKTLSPYGNERNPAYCWDVDPDDGYRLSRQCLVFDAIASKVLVTDDSTARVDMPNLFPHGGGREQTLTFRVRIRRRKHPFTRITDEEKRRSGLYGATVVYDQEHPPAWRFAEG